VAYKAIIEARDVALAKQGNVRKAVKLGLEMAKRDEARAEERAEGKRARRLHEEDTRNSLERTLDEVRAEAMIMGLKMAARVANGFGPVARDVDMYEAIMALLPAAENPLKWSEVGYEHFSSGETPAGCYHAERTHAGLDFTARRDSVLLNFECRSLAHARRGLSG